MEGEKSRELDLRAEAVFHSFLFHIKVTESGYDEEKKYGFLFILLYKIRLSCFCRGMINSFEKIKKAVDKKEGENGIYIHFQYDRVTI